MPYSIGITKDDGVSFHQLQTKPFFRTTVVFWTVRRKSESIGYVACV